MRFRLLTSNTRGNGERCVTVGTAPIRAGVISAGVIRAGVPSVSTSGTACNPAWETRGLVFRNVTGTMEITAESVVGGACDPYGATGFRPTKSYVGPWRSAGLVGGKAWKPSGSPMIFGFSQLEVSP